RFKIAGQIVSICGCPVRRSQCQVHIPVADADRRGARRNPMAKFVYVYAGGQMAETPEAQEQAMQAWGARFGTLGDSVAVMGKPFGNSATGRAGGVAGGGKSGAGGYSIVSAGSLSD